MDSGNSSGLLSPTRSRSSTLINTNLNPTDILAFVEQLPKFEGPPDNLEKFITSVEELLLLIKSVDQTPYGQLLLRGVRNKIIGKADEALILCDTRLNWDDVKTNLKRLYSSKKTEAMLLREIQTLPDGLTMGKLFFTIIKLRSQLTTLAKDIDQNSYGLAAKRALYDEICLNAFIVGLKDPLRTIIRTRNPETIEKAYEYGQIEQSFFYQNRQQEDRNHDRSKDRNHPYLRRNQQEQKQSNNNNNNNSNNRYISHQQTNTQQRGQTVSNQNPFRNNGKSISSNQQSGNGPSTGATLCNISDDGNFPLGASVDQSGT
ncbi:chloride channel protein E-like [Bactrocera dorsalis]|uniref:Chloride channel protein E-like n=1 Tax=Bactrocera dorsalis TaxID=27457 RepID=A0ABM3JEA3_BACDO|nr:chloride channel protein E-like [Bactrocera dorsalis]